MKFHLWFGAAMFVAVFAPSSSWGGESTDAATPSVGVAAQKSQRVALRVNPARAPASAAPRRGNATPYRSVNQTFAGISRETKTVGNPSDDWSTGASSKPAKGKPGKKKLSK